MMNERIKELAEQAGFQYIKDERIGWAGNYNASLPKFAELIVRECGDWIINNASSIDHLGPEYFAKAMKQHYGIK